MGEKLYLELDFIGGDVNIREDHHAKTIEEKFRDGDDVAVVYGCGRVFGFDAALQRLTEAESAPATADPGDLEIPVACPEGKCEKHIDRVEYREHWV